MESKLHCSILYHFQCLVPHVLQDYSCRYQYGDQTWESMDGMLTFTPKELLEAAGHHGSWHHPPHAMWRLVSTAWLCLHRPRSVGLLQKMLEMLSAAATLEHAQEVLSHKSEGTAQKEHRCVL